MTLKNLIAHRKKALNPLNILMILLKGIFIYGMIGVLCTFTIKTIQSKLPKWLNDYFNLTELTRINEFMNKQTAFFRDNISFSSPSSISSYLSALSADTVTATKLSVLKTLVVILENILSISLSALLYILFIILFFKCISYCKNRFNQRLTTYEIVYELKPILNEINENLKQLLNKNTSDKRS